MNALNAHEQLLTEKVGWFCSISTIKVRSYILQAHIPKACKGNFFLAYRRSLLCGNYSIMTRATYSAHGPHQVGVCCPLQELLLH
jgi:hypothetical protein